MGLNMDLGLVCPQCAHLSPLRAEKCEKCHTPLFAPSSTPPSANASESQASPSESAATIPDPQFRNEASPEGEATLPPENRAPATPTPSPSEAAAETASSAPQGQTLYFSSMQEHSSAPRLVLIKGGSQDGVTYRLSSGTHDLGRSQGDMRFDGDEYLSTPHARFSTYGEQLVVEDLGSLNGIFVRIQRSAEIEHGSLFLVGEQLLRIDTRPIPEFGPNANGTYFYGSPRPEGSFRVTQCLAGGGEGYSCSAALGDRLTIGRDDNDFDFPEDRFISGHHARVDRNVDDGTLTLYDLNSRNGTFLRIDGRQVLQHGDYLFIGQQLFRVELN